MDAMRKNHRKYAQQVRVYQPDGKMRHVMRSEKLGQWARCNYKSGNNDHLDACCFHAGLMAGVCVLRGCLTAKRRSERDVPPDTVEAALASLANVRCHMNNESDAHTHIATSLFAEEWTASASRCSIAFTLMCFHSQVLTREYQRALPLIIIKP